MRTFITTSTALALTLAFPILAPSTAAAEQHQAQAQSGSSESGGQSGEQMELTQEQQDMLDGLSPEVRQQVVDRLGPEQTVEGILETMIINAVSDRYPGAEDYVPDIANKNVEVVFKDERLLVNVDPQTLEVVDAEKM